MAAVVYEGVGGGGELFRGIKFCLMQRIPTRNRWKDLVVANGGEIVPLEKQADIVIADHARKDSPEDSISWTFIESSIKKGDLEDIENHRAGPATRVVRQVGSAAPTRQGRTKFTAEDDRILMKWCAKAERQGKSLKGNDLYQDLEKINNRHTFQSWRDRWIKYVSLLPRPKVAEDDDNEENVEANEEPSPSRRPVARAHPPSSVPPPTTRQSIPKSRVATSRSPAEPPQSNSVGSSPIPLSPDANPFVQKSVGGTVFSEEETQELLDVYDEVINISPDQQIDAWIAWATKYPRHTAQEWRNYFFEYIVPKITSNITPKLSEPQAKAPTTAPKVAPAKATHTIETLLGPSSSKPGKVEVLEVKDSQGSSGRTLEPPKKGRKAADPSMTDEALFRKELSETAALWEETIGEFNPDFSPVVCGRRISLFRLWQVVESDEFGGWDEVNGLRLWPKVARKLNFNDYKHPEAAAKLEAIFISALLVDHDEIKREEWKVEDDMSLTESQEMALINDQLLQTADHERQSSGDVEELKEEEEDDDLDGPQSTPIRPLSSPSGKRSFDTSRQDSTYNKRQRIDKGKGEELEIPSTPEDVINGNQLIRPSYQPSPLYYTSAQPEEADDGDDESASEAHYIDNLVTHIRPPNFQRTIPSTAEPRLPTRTLEPETQDFHFPPEQEQDIYAADDLTPSPVQSIPKAPDRSRGSDVATHGTVHSSSKNEDSTQSRPNSQPGEDLSTYIDGWIQLGYPQDIVIEALEAMSMERRGDAGHVMEALLEGHGVPKDLGGVWTWYDDEIVLKGRSHPDWGRIVTKHGIPRCKTRKQFLKDKKEAEEAEGADDGEARS
ncbi:uncharacterized protein PAC_02296 [Phialocephala subalpina]|uniref:DNA-binding protein RAP1 n=1 Tax=Phialocephala subalpina TaxID=576137 RepID=A0A1L7WI19_9HELO|nr:uncharacterized protein PAC_02296 [Phialocephala subalpina]